MCRYPLTMIMNVPIFTDYKIDYISHESDYVPYIIYNEFTNILIKGIFSILIVCYST